MEHETNVVVVGGGAAGHAAATSLRESGCEGRITMVLGEGRAPYNRTLVNKAVLPGLLEPEQIALPDLAALEVATVAGRASAIDPAGRALVLEDGRRLPYGALVLATGSAPRVDTAGIGAHALHTIDDALALRASLGSVREATVTVLGAGFVGAETASALAEGGATVRLVSRPELPLTRALGHRIAEHVVDLHRDHVDAYFGREVARIDHKPGSVEVTLVGGERLESDLVIAAYGTDPASAWATGKRARGVRVDDRLRAESLPGVYAAGSVAVHSGLDDQPYRIDHWDAAAAQGAHAARAVLHDLEGAPDPGPYRPGTGFTLNLYRTPIAAYGTAPRGSVERTRETETGIITEFRDRAGRLTGAAGLRAGRELLELRARLVRP